MICNLKTKSVIPAGKGISKEFAFDEADVSVIDSLGFGMSPEAKYSIAQNKESYGFDEAPALQTVASVGTPIQFLRWWSNKLIKTVYTPRRIDDIAGITNAGSWEDEEVVVPEIETTGEAVLYGDYNNSFNSNYNTNFNKRSVVRFMSSVTVGNLEARQASAMRIDAKAQKMIATSNALEIQRNSVGFRGFLNGNKANYGLLNDPRLSEYETLSTGASKDTTWMTKTTIEIINDLRMMIQSVVDKTGGIFDPLSDSFTIVIPNSVNQAFTAVTELGYSVQEWLDKTFKKVRVVQAYQLEKAVGEDNACYIIVDNFNGEKNVDQFVQQKMFLVGFDRRDTYVKETYSNATAGVFIGYPIAVGRWLGC